MMVARMPLLGGAASCCTHASVAEIGIATWFCYVVHGLCIAHMCDRMTIVLVGAVFPLAMRI